MKPKKQKSTPMLASEPRIISVAAFQHFAGLPETEWPAPSGVQLAQVAAAMNDGSDAERVSRAISLAWDAALAQHKVVTNVRAFHDLWNAGMEETTEVSRKFNIDLSGPALVHAKFLALLNTKPLRVRQRPLKAADEPALRGATLWRFFVKSEILSGSCMNLATGEEEVIVVTDAMVKEYENRCERDGWEPGVALHHAIRFDKWRARIVSSRKREAAQAGKKVLEASRFTTRVKKKAPAKK